MPPGCHPGLPDIPMTGDILPRHPCSYRGPWRMPHKSTPDRYTCHASPLCPCRRAHGSWRVLPCNFIITNGLKLTDDIINTIIDLQYERLYISLDAATPETYKKIRGHDLCKIEKNINNLISARNNSNSKLPLIRTSFVVMKDNYKERELFLEKWQNVVDIVDFQKYVDYIPTEQRSADIPNIPYPCPDPFRTLTIRANGDILPCCTSYGESFVLGNLSTTTLQEAFNSEKMKELRKNILSGNMPIPCRYCSQNFHE